MTEQKCEGVIMGGMGNQSLAPRQQRFVDEYLIDLNATQAVIRAGYKVASEQAAAVIGHENLRKLKIAEAIRVAQAELAKRAEITPEVVIREYAKLAFADMNDYVSWGPDGVHLVPSDQLPEGATGAVMEVSETVTDKGSTTVRFKLHDKKGALDSLAKHLGMFAGKGENPINVQNKLTIADLVLMSADGER